MGKNYDVFQFSRDELIPYMAFVSSRAKHRFPEPGYLMTSDIAWRLPLSAPKRQIRLWKEGANVIGYVWFTPNDVSVLDTSVPELLPDLVKHAADQAKHYDPTNPWLLSIKNMTQWQAALQSGEHLLPAEERLLQVTAFDKDLERQVALKDLGFRSTDHTAKHLKIDLNSVDEPSANNSGVVFRAVRNNELEKRAQLHRDAWVGSTFSLDTYLKVRESPVFEPNLHVVAVEENGEFGSYCIGWMDAGMKTGSFEPVGTHKKFRGRGLAENVIRTTLWKMKKVGMTTSKISTAGFNRPAFDLYQRCGFTFTDFERTYIKSID